MLIDDPICTYNYDDLRRVSCVTRAYVPTGGKLAPMSRQTLGVGYLPLTGDATSLFF
jgi:hypothetical protein